MPHRVPLGAPALLGALQARAGLPKQRPQFNLRARDRRLENRRGLNTHRGFESLSLRIQPLQLKQLLGADEP